MNAGNWQIEHGRLLVAFFWLDWVFSVMPLNVRGRQEGALLCIGPFRIGWFPSDEQLKEASDD